MIFKLKETTTSNANESPQPTKERKQIILLKSENEGETNTYITDAETDIVLNFETSDATAINV